MANRVGVIYRLLNKKDGKSYIGQTNRPCNVRWQQHKNMLIAGTHFNKHLQRAVHRDGLESFEFLVIEDGVLLEHLDERENYWIENTANIYNFREGGRGGLHSEETKRKISLAMKGKLKTEVHKIRIGMASKGNQYCLGRKQSVETIAKRMAKMPRKLTLGQVLQIRELYSYGKMSQAQLANRYGVGKTTIHSIIHFKKWKNIHG